MHPWCLELGQLYLCCPWLGHTYSQTHLPTPLHTFTHTHTRPYTYTHTPTHTHTHTHARIRMSTRFDNSLSVSAHHESLQEGHHVTRRFSKLIRLPAEIESESLTSSLKDGVLAIQAPLADQQKNNSRIVDIPIEKIG